MRRCIAFLACLCLALSVAVPALAKPAASAVTIKADEAHGVLSGTVTSSKSGCVKHRGVSLYWSHGAAFHRAAEDKTNKQGEWKIVNPSSMLPPGKYFAQIAAGKSCAGDKSRIIKVQQSEPTR